MKNVKEEAKQAATCGKRYVGQKLFFSSPSWGIFRSYCARVAAGHSSLRQHHSFTFMYRAFVKVYLVTVFLLQKVMLLLLEVCGSWPEVHHVRLWVSFSSVFVKCSCFIWNAFAIAIYVGTNNCWLSVFWDCITFWRFYTNKVIALPNISVFGSLCMIKW